MACTASRICRSIVLRVDVGAKQPGRAQLAGLQHRPVDLVVNGFVQLLERIRDHADNGEPAAVAALEPLANRILVGPVVPRHRLVDDDDRVVGVQAAIGWRECTSAHHRLADRGEVVGSRDMDVDLGSRRVGRKLPSFDLQRAGEGAPLVQWERAAAADGPDPGFRSQAFFEPLPESRACGPRDTSRN